MDLRRNELEIGLVKEVDGNTLSVKANNLEFDFSDEKRFVEVGSFVNCGGHHGNTICIVSRVRVVEVEISSGIIEHKIVELSIVGHIKVDSFSRGVDRLPTVNCKCFLLLGTDVNKMLGEEDQSTEFKKNFLVGYRGNRDEDNVFLNVDKLFGRHVSILGTTGSGKSCTVASIMQSVLTTYNHPRVIFFDIHNEYHAAFQEEWEGKAKYTSWENFSLPYWFLDLDELIGIYHPNAGSTQKAEIKRMIIDLKKEALDSADTKVLDRVSVETPIFFNMDKLIEMIQDKIDSLTPSKQDSWLTMKLKFESIHNDSRYNFLKKDIENQIPLLEYFQSLLGIADNKYLQILDLSGLPAEVRTVCVGVLSRLCFDYRYWDVDPENLPIALVLEEAHTYIPDEDSSKFALCKERVERIAKEGRKYGISLVVVSQRPSNVSTTVLSQCGTFITLRLTNDIDQNKIKRLLPDTLGDQASILPSLRDGQALVTGDAILLPSKIQFKEPNPFPKSNDVRYHHSWSVGIPENYNLQNVIESWKVRERLKAEDSNENK